MEIVAIARTALCPATARGGDGSVWGVVPGGQVPEICLRSLVFTHQRRCHVTAVRVA